MSTKLIAIGNRLMRDDAVAIYVAEKLKGFFEGKGIEVIIGETDFEYCLDMINEDDYIIILDSTCRGIRVGEITRMQLKNTYNLSSNKKLFSQHGYSLINGIETYYKEIDGVVIGIEGSKFDFGQTLSIDLDRQFCSVCRKIEAMVYPYEGNEGI